MSIKPGAAAPSANRLGCIVIFILITFAYVIQTELTQAVQRTYRKPFLLLFLTHSGYICILPLHLLLLRLLYPQVSLRQRLTHLRTLAILQSNYQQQQQQSSHVPSLDQQPLLPTTHESAYHYTQQAFPLAWFLWRSVQLTLFLALPAMCWYGAVPFADMTSITSIFNTNACFTYLFAVLLIREERFDSRKSLAVLGSLLGALMISYSEQSASSDNDHHHDPQPSQNPAAHLRPLGILLALLGSIGYALYEVWYKSSIAWSDTYYVTLDDPQQPTLIRDPTTTLDASSDIITEESSSSESGTALADPDYLVSYSSPTHLGSDHPDDDQDDDNPGIKPRLQILHPQQSLHSQDALLHANLMTTMVGVCTLCLLWIPLPFLHWAGIEHFELVHDPTIACMILGIILMGVLFNAGFMILLGLWGPVVASVGNLCTLVLIAIIDHTPIGGLNSQLPDWSPRPFGLLSLLGCAAILVGFSILNF
ncbi:hypothetical protein PCASD_06379 [Puccinia coronata f. sp. avenae]|uniref:EamA domain-containing protein n=1 Tax=Puccinia coronata f. sp. avenae TaxID=200324 RepID=A0A2N5UX60_9BASI|nr:hypothetical protein PCASD_06379 [Puccinia coronata f. sp. avenae]